MINVLIFIRSFFNIYFNVFVSFSYFGIISMFLVPVICMFAFKHYVKYVKEINIIPQIY